jgi:hypothetical protein
MWNTQIELFKKMRPPLRPHASEAALVADVAAASRAAVSTGDLHVLLLGLTQELIHISWPRGTNLTVVDRSENMIRQFWPGDIPGERKLIRADWFGMPFEKPSFHLIVGDGVLNFKPFPAGFRDFLNHLLPYLYPAGHLCARVFTQLDVPEKTESLMDELRRSERVNYYEFRYRQATSLQKSAGDGFDGTKETLDRMFESHGVPLSELYAKSGFKPPDVPAVKSENPEEQYRVYYPTEAEFLQACPPGFKFIRKMKGAHTLAYRTPIFVLQRSDQLADEAGS